MKNRKEVTIGDGQRLNTRARARTDAQQAGQLQQPIEGVALNGRSASGHEQIDAMDHLFLSLDMRGALPRGARSPKPRGAKEDPGGKGTAPPRRVAAPRQAGRKRRPQKQVQRKHRVKKDF